MNELGLSKLQFASMYVTASIIIFFLLLRNPFRKIRKQTKSSEGKTIGALQTKYANTNSIDIENFEKKLNKLLDEVSHVLIILEDEQAKAGKTGTLMV